MHSCLFEILPADLFYEIVLWLNAVEFLSLRLVSKQVKMKTDGEQAYWNRIPIPNIKFDQVKRFQMQEF